MSPNGKRRLLGLTTVLFVAASVLSLVIALRIRTDTTDPLAEALHLAQAAGSYRFSSDITQVTVPTSKVSNVGRSSRTDQLHLEGETNLRDQSTHMRLWTQQGSVNDPTSGIAVRVENGRTYVQEGLGAWREHEDLTDGFAPQGDFMAFLVALRDPVAHTPEERNGIRFTRYTFRLDGLTLAQYMRDVTEDILRKRGELPIGAQLEVPAYYRDMVGDGELWIDSQGLPLRQIIRMRFPEQRDEIVQAEMCFGIDPFERHTFAAVTVEHTRRSLVVHVDDLCLRHVGNVVSLLLRPLCPGQVFQAGQGLIVGILLPEALAYRRIGVVTKSRLLAWLAEVWVPLVIDLLFGEVRGFGSALLAVG